MLPRPLINLVTSRSGATSLEVGLLVALIAVAAIAAFTAMGASLDGLFSGAE